MWYYYDETWRSSGYVRLRGFAIRMKKKFTNQPNARCGVLRTSEEIPD